MLVFSSELLTSLSCSLSKSFPRSLTRETVVLTYKSATVFLRRSYRVVLYFPFYFKDIKCFMLSLNTTNSCGYIMK
jgi:hypothetical protein